MITIPWPRPFNYVYSPPCLNVMYAMGTNCLFFLYIYVCVVQRYQRLYDRNEKQGSFYILSKVQRAKECLEVDQVPPPSSKAEAGAKESV